MAPSRVILMSCGSYNPPTNMHLRMFEIARDHLHRMGTHIVVGGVISPTHDEYGKKELISSEHRRAMLKLATENSDWIKVSTWEMRQNGWTKTRLSLQHHQNMLNSVLLDSNDIKHYTQTEDIDWIPENVKNSSDSTPIQIKLLCGADLLESFGTPGLWADEDIDAIVGQHGLVVITREGSNPNKFIYDSDILSKYMHNIHIVTEWISNEVSSTKIRRALKRGESVRYLVQDSVIEYIYKNGIYEAKTVPIIKLELLPKNDNEYLSAKSKYESAFLTPSPSDVTMASPVEIISIDISESVLKKNFHNAPINAKTNYTITRSEDSETLREKFGGEFTENVNKIVGANKIAYPGQAKQIIATESGESHIFCEVGLSCVSENYELEIDGKVDRLVENENRSADELDGEKSENKVVDDSFELVKSDERAPTPDESEEKLSVILSIDVIDASSIDDPRFLDASSLRENSHENSLEEENDINGKIVSEENMVMTSRDEEEEISPLDGDKSFKLKEELPEESQVPENVIESTSAGKDLTEQEVPSSDVIEKSIEELIEKPKDGASDSTSEESARKLSSNIEIDGKYIKSVVNSRKSPKKLRQEEICPSLEKKIEEPEPIDSEDRSVPFVRTDVTRKSFKSGRKRGVVFQGSLDSINVDETKSTKSLNNKNEERISKKSKSYEFIKTSELQPMIICQIPLNGSKEDESCTDEMSKTKTESTTVMTTANERESGQTDEFCSVCCFTNEPSSTEAFYTLRSTGSSPLEEASTECDICSNCDLREDLEGEKSKLTAEPAPGEPVCELCEICGDVAMEEDVVASSRPEKDDFVERRLLSSRPLPLSLPKRKKAVLRLNARNFSNVENDDETDDDEDEDDVDIDNFDLNNTSVARKIIGSRDKLQMVRKKSLDQQSTDETNSNDEFEIENCGADLDDKSQNEIQDTLRSNLPRDEIAMAAKGQKMSRAGSLINRDTIDRAGSKRRYSSVDNLQSSHQGGKTVGKQQRSLRFRGVSKGLVASADNIRPVRSSRARTTLRKSADDVGRGYHSAIDDTRESPLYENVASKKFDSKDQKRRDSGTIKMILTKHGIKIISDNETAL